MKKSFEDRIDIIIQTQRGDIPLSNTNIGDIVYNYETGDELEIKGFTTSDIEDVYEAEYTDGRKAYYRYSELIYKGDIQQYPIEYNKNRIVHPLTPDSYITGALIIYGKNDDKYLNLPLDRTAVNSLFAHKYQLNYGDKLGNNRVYFSYDGKSRDDLITWKEFFPDYLFYGRTKNPRNPIVPLEYRRASIDDRWQFIRGVFDMGFDEKLFPDSCSIGHESERSLLAVQEILWSLGILSTIIYDPNLLSLNKRGWEYRLDIQGNYNGYPGFFYDISSLEKMLKKQKIIQKFKLQLKSIKWYTRAYSSNIILEKPNMIYLTGNFLPRISI